MRLPLICITTLFLALGATTACSGPHSGKSEKLKKPRKKERPKDDEAASQAPENVVDTKCKTNFFDEPTKRRSARDASRIAAKADPMLAEASASSGDEKIGLLVSAIDKLSNALKKDPYGPEPTFKMAVAYAMAGKQGCSLALLKRLAALQTHPDVDREASRTVKRALNEQAFDSFREEADKALGE